MLNIYLDELHALLESVGEKKWGEKFKYVSSESVLDNRRQYLEKIIGLYGGAGSLNDLMISELNGHTIGCGSESALNKDMNYLRSKIYNLAKKELRELVDL
ncbi:Uncharacterised protein [Zhongshania aliphaticivorans]|uniref:DUF6966 domain-containing protein n=1 Tax=Zhongshania aliphaticivorans TaxID=1470434 RepID=A0A5S9N425_9GAMM|nr:hypothetical protein [Zhongshania aliphaticivorans]CAA0082045.1 Uncharacterised protein [Zhongshania aliphaticivorans]CAA0084606.1 Uncharacterised protein [Zhongshania aliphaticivorans]